MTPLVPVASGLSESTFALCLVLLVLAPLAIAGVALINTGLGRSRSAAQALLGSLVVVAVAVVFGYALLTVPEGSDAGVATLTGGFIVRL